MSTLSFFGINACMESNKTNQQLQNPFAQKETKSIPVTTLNCMLTFLTWYWH